MSTLVDTLKQRLIVLNGVTWLSSNNSQRRLSRTRWKISVIIKCGAMTECLAWKITGSRYKPCSGQNHISM